MAVVSGGALAALALISALGAGAQQAGKSAENKSIREENKERWLDQLSLKNRELNTQQQQFREKMNLMEKKQKESSVSNIMNMLGTLGGLQRQPASTASVLEGLI